MRYHNTGPQLVGLKPPLHPSTILTLLLIETPSFYIMSPSSSARDEPEGSRGYPIDLSDGGASTGDAENHNVQITQQELEIPQEDVFENQTSTHQKMTTSKYQALKPIYAANVGKISQASAYDEKRWKKHDG
jgi:hypothetical protein